MKLTKQEKIQKKKDEDWMSRKWRPMMAIMYMICCICDFVLFPILFTVVQFWEVQAANDAFRQWAPITLLGGGLFHVAMGAVLGVTAFGRTQEKIAGASNISTMQPTGFVTQQSTTMSYSAPVQNTQQTPSSSWSSPWSTPSVATTASGKKIVPEFEQPLI